MTEGLELHIKSELSKFSITDAAIAAMKEAYLPLKINGIEDRQGYSEVRAARILVKGKRVEVEKTRKALKEESLAFGRAVDTRAKEITAKLEEIECHLSDQEAAVDAEKERIRQEQERKKQEQIHGRVNKLVALELVEFNGAGYEFGDFVIFNTQIATLPDEEFEAIYDNFAFAVKKEKEMLAEKARLEQEEAEHIAKAEEETRLKREAEAAAERERLEAEKKRLEGIEREQKEKETALKAEQDKIDAEKKAIAEAKWKEEMEKKRQAELEQAQKEAAEKARIEAEQRLKREAEEKAEAERLAKLEAERQESLRPDKEKLIALAYEIEAFTMPGGFASEEAKVIIAEVRKRVQAVAAYIRKGAKDI